jgi:hypothetical protein
MRSHVRLGVVGVAVAMSALVACRESELPKGRSETPRADDTPPPDLSLAPGYELARPIVDGRLSLVPVMATTATPPRIQFTTLTAGLRAGTATATDGYGTDRVLIANNGDKPLFAMNGEIMVEAHQDRSLAENRVIAPGGSEMVAVRCVEASRSSGDTLQFAAGGAIAEISLRQRLRYTEQGEVWAHIDAINVREGLAPPTRTYRFAAKAQTEGQALARRDRILAMLAKVPNRDRMVGLGLAVDGQVQVIDRFATPELYRDLEPMLVASYIPAEAALPETSHLSHKLHPDDLRRFDATRAARSDTDAAVEVLRPLRVDDGDQRD